MTYIIAEISGNHGGYLHKALELIEAAADCGAPAVKFQLYKPEDLYDPSNNHIYQKYQVPTDWLEPMFTLAEKVDVELFASVFAPWAVKALHGFQPKFYKIASPESTRLPEYGHIVDAIRSTGIRIIWSSGKRDIRLWEEYANALDISMYCKPGYPAAPLDTGDLYYIHQAHGFSDHTLGIKDTLAAVGAGATFIEKHFKIDDDCVDAAFSINPKELKALCDLCS